MAQSRIYFKKNVRFIHDTKLVVIIELLGKVLERHNDDLLKNHWLLQ